MPMASIPCTTSPLPSSGGGQSPSDFATVKVKRLIPGGYDPDAGAEYINESLSASSGIPAFIDDVVADGGVIA
jgi:hypothetical protein